MSYKFLIFLFWQPFDILMHVQNIDQSEAGLTVNVEVKPEIRGEVDSVKLARLLTALGQVNFPVLVIVFFFSNAVPLSLTFTATVIRLLNCLVFAHIYSHR